MKLDFTLTRPDQVVGTSAVTIPTYYYYVTCCGQASRNHKRYFHMHVSFGQHDFPDRRTELVLGIWGSSGVSTYACEGGSEVVMLYIIRLGANVRGGVRLSYDKKFAAVKFKAMSRRIEHYTSYSHTYLLVLSRRHANFFDLRPSN
jgi:hypothetical protein